MNAGSAARWRLGHSYGKTISIMDQQEKTAKPALKICGLTLAEDLIYCIQQQVSYVGFNFFAGSKRFIKPEEAASLWRRVLGAEDSPTRAVAVFVEPSFSQLNEALACFPELSVIQIHGKLALEALGILRPVLGRRELWVALAVAQGQAVAEASIYDPIADLLLFDSAVIPSGLSVPGGSGVAFDWRFLNLYRGRLPVGVAGGLKSSNLPALAAVIKPALVDVCSGVEKRPGVKDAGLISEVIGTVNRLW